MRKELKMKKFVIEMEDGGVMKGELYEDIAPKTVANFEKLASEGFYDGLIFHRVIPGFMIQGGCPNGTGMGGPGYTIEGEFSSNGFKNDLKHERGVLSMARAMDPNSAGSQFFIMTTTSPHLDGQYAAFGKVTEGMETADKIVNSKTNMMDKPLRGSEDKEHKSRGIRDSKRRRQKHGKRKVHGKAAKENKRHGVNWSSQQQAQPRL